MDGRWRRHGGTGDDIGLFKTISALASATRLRNRRNAGKTAMLQLGRKCASRWRCSLHLAAPAHCLRTILCLLYPYFSLSSVLRLSSCTALTFRYAAAPHRRKRRAAAGGSSATAAATGALSRQTDGMGDAWNASGAADVAGISSVRMDMTRNAWFQRYKAACSSVGDSMPRICLCAHADSGRGTVYRHNIAASRRTASVADGENGGVLVKAEVSAGEFRTCGRGSVVAW
jgi:hypothetical protein